jgi:hypothetical protein
MYIERTQGRYAVKSGFKPGAETENELKPMPKMEIASILKPTPTPDSKAFL